MSGLRCEQVFLDSLAGGGVGLKLVGGGRLLAEGQVLHVGRVLLAGVVQLAALTQGLVMHWQCGCLHVHDLVVVNSALKGG